ncbi:melanocortin receptor 5-like [Porites lutea]|uniref:melanocortin receptor 5-like n=1 Tax=Porites lutea TaxID=51062 RepID=UPI003CC56BB2
MNNTDKSCFFFEYNVAIFDQLEDVFITNIITCILNCLFSLITCLGNFLILFAIGKNRDLHSPSFILLGCLAASDLLVGLICQPLFVASNIAELRKNYNAHCTLRMLLHFTGWMTAGVSLLILTAVLIDRLLALILHLRYNTIVTVPRVFLIILCFWIFAITLNVARFWMSKKWYFIAIAFFVLPFLVITLSTLKIFQISRKHQSQINDQHVAVSHLQSNAVNALKCRKSAVTVLYIYGLFVVAYLPWLLLTTAAFFIGYPRELKIASNFARTAVFINSFLNPIVYCWRNREIRRAVKNILRRGRH